MRLLLLLFRTSRVDVMVAALSSIMAGCSASGFSLVLQHTIAARGAHLLPHLFAFAACWIGYGLGSTLTAHRVTRVAQRAIRELRISLSRQILNLPLATLECEGQRIFPVLTEDIQTIAWAAENLPGAVTGAVTITGCLAVLLTISAPLTLACVLLLALALALYHLPHERFSRHLARWRAEWDRISVHLDALLHAQKDLLLDARKRDALLSRHLEPAARRQEAEMVPLSTWETLLKRWGEMLLLLGVGALLFTLPWHSLATYEQFGRFLFVALFLLAPLSTVAGFAAQIQRANLAATRAGDLGLFLGAATGPVPAPLPPQDRALVPFALCAATYRHVAVGGRSFELGPVSLVFDRPEIVFISGGNGSGKTTLLKLLCGLYAPATGAVVVDGRNLSPADLVLHRQRFAAVFADLHLFPSLVGYEHAAPARIAELLASTGLADAVTVDAAGNFSTTALSQGQRKRLALVAALLEDKPVYLFDEWAAEQDREFRRRFYEDFLPALRTRGCLVIAITHDELYYDRCDRLILLADGGVQSDVRRPPSSITAGGSSA